MEYLVKRAQKKDNQAFVQLIEMVKGDLYKVARSYLDSEADIAAQLAKENELEKEFLMKWIDVVDYQ